MPSLRHKHFSHHYYILVLYAFTTLPLLINMVASKTLARS